MYHIYTYILTDILKGESFFIVNRALRNQMNLFYCESNFEKSEICYLFYQHDLQIMLSLIEHVK